LREEGTHAVRGDRPGEAAYEEFCGALVFLPGDGAFRVDLGNAMSNGLRLTSNEGIRKRQTRK
jgi:hypothetical protein